MNRYEFIDDLRRCLSAELNAASVNEHITYYEQYIDMQLKKGKTEQEVLEELGSPRLIAKSIVVSEREKNNYYNNKEESKPDSGRNNPSDNTVHISFKTIITVLLVVLLVVIVIVAVFMVVIIRFLLPIILIGLGISMIIKTIKKR